jgi:hypothetical protein
MMIIAIACAGGSGKKGVRDSTAQADAAADKGF